MAVKTSQVSQGRRECDTGFGCDDDPTKEKKTKCSRTWRCGPPSNETVVLTAVLAQFHPVAACKFAARAVGETISYQGNSERHCSLRICPVHSLNGNLKGASTVPKFCDCIRPRRCQTECIAILSGNLPTKGQPKTRCACSRKI